MWTVHVSFRDSGCNSAPAHGYHPATTRRTTDIVLLAEINLDGEALCEAVLEGDWDEVRFLCRLLTAGAASCGLIDVGIAIAVLVELLGPVGTEPRPGYGAAMLAIASQLEALRQPS